MRIVQQKNRFILGTYGDWKWYSWDIMGKSLNLVIWYCNQMWFAGKSSCKRKFLAGKINYKWVIFDCHFWSPEDILPIHGGPAYDWDTMECHGIWIWMKKYHNLIGWRFTFVLPLIHGEPVDFQPANNCDWPTKCGDVENEILFDFTNDIWITYLIGQRQCKLNDGE